LLHHTFKAASGAYIVVIKIEERGAGVGATAGAGEASPNLTETTFERRVSLVGGEVIVSPD
jgi:hypothetical protein